MEILMREDIPTPKHSTKELTASARDTNCGRLVDAMFQVLLHYNSHTRILSAYMDNDNFSLIVPNKGKFIRIISTKRIIPAWYKVGTNRLITVGEYVKEYTIREFVVTINGIPVEYSDQAETIIGAAFIGEEIKLYPDAGFRIKQEMWSMAKDLIYVYAPAARDTKAIKRFIETTETQRLQP